MDLTGLLIMWWIWADLLASSESEGRSMDGHYRGCWGIAPNYAGKFGPIMRRRSIGDRSVVD